MKQFKLFIWIFVLVLIQTVWSVFFNIGSIVPDMLFAFTIAYSIYERSLKYILWIAVICGILMSAMGTGPFWAVTLVFVYSAAAINLSQSKFSRFSPFAKAAVFAFVLTAAGETAVYMVSSLSVKLSVILKYVLPVSFINTVLSVVMYALLKKCFDNKDIAAKLIV